MTPSIATLTVNPALDVAMDVPRLQAGHKMRIAGQIFDAGGGGINVARVLRALGSPATAICVHGGSTGRFVRELLEKADVPCADIVVAGTTRASVTVHDKSTGAEYRFVPEGPVLTGSDADRILAAVAAHRADWLVASGSLAPGLPDDFYAQVARLARSLGTRFVLDTSGTALARALHAGIDLLKVSQSEFDSLLADKPAGREACGRAAMKLAASGAASMIAVTLGSEGALLATADTCVFQHAPDVAMRSSVGAGDSFLAGLTLALAQGQSHPQALRLATATAAAAVIEDGTARVDARRVEDFLAAWRGKPTPA
jgi:6-phosphofructokinase 2